jgi:hypothetical protein
MTWLGAYGHNRSFAAIARTIDRWRIARGFGEGKARTLLEIGRDNLRAELASLKVTEKQNPAAAGFVLSYS